MIAKYNQLIFQPTFSNEDFTIGTRIQADFTFSALHASEGLYHNSSSSISLQSTHLDSPPYKNFHQYALSNIFLVLSGLTVTYVLLFFLMKLESLSDWMKS